MSVTFEEPRYLGDIERVVEDFEGRTGCVVTNSARIIITQGLQSVMDDEDMLLGASPEQREAAIGRAIEALPAFLEVLRTMPRRVPTLSPRVTGRLVGEDHAAISGLMVLQNAQRLAILSNCPCWPR
jgi:hypothetical protein